MSPAIDRPGTCTTVSRGPHIVKAYSPNGWRGSQRVPRILALQSGHQTRPPTSYSCAQTTWSTRRLARTHIQRQTPNNGPCDQKNDDSKPLVFHSKREMEIAHERPRALDVSECWGHALHVKEKRVWMLPVISFVANNRVGRHVAWRICGRPLVHSSLLWLTQWQCKQFGLVYYPRRRHSGQLHSTKKSRLRGRTRGKRNAKTGRNETRNRL